MPSAPTVSIVLPAKNAEATLARAIGSMLGQTFDNFELIVIDDHSSDGTKAVALSAAGADRRVRILDSGHTGGLVAALQKGTDAALGPFIARMDADDVSRPGRLRHQVEFLKKHPDLSACGTRVHAANPLGDGIRRYVDWSNALLDPDDIRRERFVESPVVHPSILVRAEALRAIGGYREIGWAEDYDLWLRMIEAGMGIGKHPAVLLDWHDGKDRLTRADPRYSEDQFLKAKAHFLSRLPESESRGFALCGAGPTGKRLGRFLQSEGATLHAFYEVHPRRVGEIIAGVPVKHHHEIPAANSPGDKTRPILIAAVGRPKARARVRSQLAALGYREGEDFYAAS